MTTRRSSRLISCHEMPTQPQPDRPLEFATRNIGRGGEGVVLPVAGNSALVAKVFHHPTLEHRAKLEFMVANPVPQATDHFWVTWPLDIIFTRARGRDLYRAMSCRGSRMPNPSSPVTTRPFVCKKCPRASDYRHLVHCRRATLQPRSIRPDAKRYVIGDPNESNAFVRGDARVTTN